MSIYPCNCSGLPASAAMCARRLKSCVRGGVIVYPHRFPVTRSAVHIWRQGPRLETHSATFVKTDRNHHFTAGMPGSGGLSGKYAMVENWAVTGLLRAPHRPGGPYHLSAQGPRREGPPRRCEARKAAAPSDNCGYPITPGHPRCLLSEPGGAR